jgi:23S rRNA (uridine2552-2'-O)-methyltransferase
MAYKPDDHYAQKARKENFAARSVYKLQEIDAKHKIFRPGDQVLDLGAAPGSWSQYAVTAVGPRGCVLGIDLSPVAFRAPNFRFVEQDVFTADWPALFATAGIVPPIDVVISDMAPATTGISVTDHARSLALCQAALETAKQHLRTGGSFICKLFDGEDAPAFREALKRLFRSVHSLRPQAVRKQSREFYLIAQGYVRA